MRIGEFIVLEHAPSREAVGDALAEMQLVAAELKTACMAADALFHKLQTQGVLTRADEQVCDMLVAAVGDALAAGL